MGDHKDRPYTKRAREQYPHPIVLSIPQQSP